jgi:hypothetical protein
MPDDVAKYLLLGAAGVLSELSCCTRDTGISDVKGEALAASATFDRWRPAP